MSGHSSSASLDICRILVGIGVFHCFPSHVRAGVELHAPVLEICRCMQFRQKKEQSKGKGTQETQKEHLQASGRYSEVEFKRSKEAVFVF